MYTKKSLFMERQMMYKWKIRMFSGLTQSLKLSGCNNFTFINWPVLIDKL